LNKLKTNLRIPNKLLEGHRGVFVIQGELAYRNEIKRSYFEYVKPRLTSLAIPSQYKKLLDFTSIAFCDSYITKSQDEKTDYLHSIKTSLVVWLTAGMEKDSLSARVLFDLIFEREKEKLITVISIHDYKNWMNGLSFIDESIRGDLVLMAKKI